MHVERISQLIQEKGMFALRVRIPDSYQGSDGTYRLAERIKRDGIKKILIVCDQTIVKFNLADKFQKELEDMGIKVAVYDGAIPNPTIGVVEDGVRFYRENGCNGIAAIGGGSSMDTGKMIAARVGNPDIPVNQMGGNLHIKKKIAPLYAIPTTAGTGSEATLAAVVVEEKDHHKYSVNDPKLVPIACALDPNLTVSLPKSVTGQTGLDALTHAVEGYTNIYGMKKAYEYAKSAVGIILNNLEEAYDHGDNVIAREKMLLGSFKAGAAFTRNCVGYVHAIGHQLSGFYNLPHGQVMATLLPIVMRKYGDLVTKPLAELYDIVLESEKKGRRSEESFIRSQYSGSRNERKAELFIKEIERLGDKFQIPKTYDCINEADIPKMVNFAFNEVKTYPTPEIWTREDIYNIYKMLMG